MRERIRLALDAHAEDPAGAAQALRALIDEDQAQFVRAAALLRNEQDKAGFLPLVEILAQTEGVSGRLCDPQLLDKHSAVDLARRIAAIAPALDGKLVRLLPGRDSDDSDPAKMLQAERILELLDAIADSGRVAPMLAHHSIVAEYDDKKPITLRGTVTTFDWTNPHVYLYLDVRESNGKFTNGAVEYESTLDLKRSCNGCVKLGSQKWTATGSGGSWHSSRG